MSARWNRWFLRGVLRSATRGGLVGALSVTLLTTALAAEILSFDAQPFQHQGTTMVPMRGIFEWLGAEVVYYKGEITAITGEGADRREIHLREGQQKATIGGQEVTLAVAPLTRDNRTYVPLRFVAEALGALVEYDAGARRITITKGAKQGALLVASAATSAARGREARILVPGKGNNTKPPTQRPRDGQWAGTKAATGPASAFLPTVSINFVVDKQGTVVRDVWGAIQQWSMTGIGRSRGGPFSFREEMPIREVSFGNSKGPISGHFISSQSATGSILCVDSSGTLSGTWEAKWVGPPPTPPSPQPKEQHSANTQAALRAQGAEERRPTERVKPAPAANPQAVVWRTPEPPTMPQGGNVWVNPKDGAEMVCVPAGEFLMGSTKEEADAAFDAARRQSPQAQASWFTDEEPQRRVQLDAYWIDKNPVTVAQYRKFCQATGREMPPHVPSWGWKEDHPMVLVTWEEAAAYGAWAGTRLPTEAEWEKAARGTDGRQYPWGNEWDPSRCANSAGGRLTSTQPITSYPRGASSYGCLHMAANVWEWCADWYQADYYRSAPDRNPQGPTSGEARVLRGGPWFEDRPEFLRCADRDRCDPNLRAEGLGFRYVRGPAPAWQQPIALLDRHPGASPTQPAVNSAALPATARGGQIWTSPQDGAEMVYVPAGEFLMGEDEDSDGGRQRRVYLDAYWIDRNLVTVAQYRKFCQATGREMPRAPSWEWKDNHPIVNVTWEDAAAYAAWAGKRLPTEAEWEKAARGPDGRQYPWGNEWDPSRCASSVGGRLTSTQPIGSYPQGASPYGCLDIAGNVSEWCADWYQADYYRSAPDRNPLGPSSGDQRVLRGGCWFNGIPEDFRCAHRGGYYPGTTGSNFGFRCARGPESPLESPVISPGQGAALRNAAAPVAGRQVTSSPEDEMMPSYDGMGNLTFSTGGRPFSTGSVDVGGGKYLAWLSPSQAGRGRAVDADFKNERDYTRGAWVQWASLSGDKIEVVEEWGQQVTFSGGGTSFRTTVTRRIVLTRGQKTFEIAGNASPNAAPAISPNGNVVLYCRDRGQPGSAGTEIVRVSVDGLEERVLTEGTANDCLARFAPDGKSIYFVSNRLGESDIWVMDADGSNQKPLTKGAKVFAGISVAPDGSGIAFPSIKGIDAPTAASGKIWLVNTDGTGLFRVTSEGTSQWPAFNRDGTKLAYQTCRSGNWDVWVLDLTSIKVKQNFGFPLLSQLATKAGLVRMRVSFA